MKKLERFDIIDSIRFIACFLVLFGHFNIPGFKYGWIGVDIFFVVSGFVVFGSLEKRAFEHKDNLYLISKFLFDRFIRLYPALIFTVLIGAILTTLLSILPDIKYQFQTGLSALGGQSNNTLHNIGADYFALSAKSNFFTHTWSLAVEFQFYLLISLATLFYRSWLKLNHKYFLFFFTALLFLWFYRNTGWSYLTVDRAWEFVAGIIAYKFAKKSKLNLIMLFTFLIAIFLVLMISKSETFSIFIIVILTALMLCFNSFSYESKFFSKVFFILGKHGRATYSIYLVHWPISVFLNETIGFENYLINIFAIASSWVLGLISYKFLEKLPLNFVRDYKLFNNFFSQKLIACTLIPLIIFFGLISPKTSDKGFHIIRNIIYETNNKYDAYVPMLFQGLPKIEPLNSDDPCHYLSSKKIGEIFFKSCLEDKNKYKPNFYLIGDSHAQMLQYGLRDALNILGYDFYWIHNNGMNKIIKNGQLTIPELDYLKDKLSGGARGDVLAFTFYRGKLNDNIEINLKEKVSDSQKNKVQNFENFFLKNINKLLDEDIKIILINDGPRLKLNLRAQVCLIRERLSGSDPCALSEIDSKIDRTQMTKLFSNLSSISKNIFILDYHDQICNNVCTYQNEEYFIMTDFNHITKEASYNLSNFWQSELKSILEE